MIEKLINIFFPHTCPVCGNVVRDDLICRECMKEVHYIREPRCNRCGKGLYDKNEIMCPDCKKNNHYYNRGVCVFEYGGKIKESIYKFKFKNYREYGDYYGREAARVYAKIFSKWKIDALIPVPMYKKKEIKRGYNQAEIFAKSVSKYTHIHIIKECIVRIKETTPQKELVGIRRKQNLEGAFMVDVDKIRFCKRVLLIDDIYTTGSTIDACAKILKAAGIKEVYFLCISTGSL